VVDGNTNGGRLEYNKTIDNISEYILILSMNKTLFFYDKMQPCMQVLLSLVVREIAQNNILRKYQIVP